MKYIYYMIGLCLLAACSKRPVSPAQSGELPRLFPDYVGVTVPVGIAPLNFTMADEAVECMDVVVRGAKGGELYANGEEADFGVCTERRQLDPVQGLRDDGQPLCP